MRRPAARLLLLLFCLLLSGCWDYIEVETLTFVIGAGVDITPENHFKLSVETFEVRGGNQTEIIPYVTSATGLTIFNALRNLTNTTGKQMFFGHSQAIVFSEEFARKGVGEVVGFMQRDAGVRTNMWLLVAKDASAEEVFKADYPLSPSVGVYLNSVMDVQERNPTFIPMQIWEFSRALNEEGMAAILPTITLIEQDDKKIPMVEGTAVFDSDRMIGWLDVQDTRILGYLLTRRITGLLVIEPEFRGETKPVVAEVRASQVKINPKWENDQLSMEIVVRLFLDLHELGFEVFDYSQTDLKRFLEEAFARQMKSDIEHLLNTVQKDLKLDIIGFGSMTKKKVPQAWRKLGGKKWKSEFPQISVMVHVSALITETGILAKPITARY